MKSIEKLRTAARNMARGRNVENHEECNLLLVIADEIEAEIERDYMKRPLGADGAPVSIGDVMTRPIKDSRTTYTVEELKYDGRSWWYACDGNYYACDCASHVKPDPLKELLHDACMNATRIRCMQGVGKDVSVEVDETELASYAERIRELMGVDR